MPYQSRLAASLLLLSAAACSGDAAPAAGNQTAGSTAGAPGQTGGTPTDTATGSMQPMPDAAPPPPVPDVYQFANGCYAVTAESGAKLVLSAGDAGYEFKTGDGVEAEPFFLKASDLGTYLLYDSKQGYLISEAQGLERATALQSDVLMVDDSYESPAEWEVEAASDDPDDYLVKHRKSRRYLRRGGTTQASAEAIVLRFEPASGCATHPELSLDAEGEVTKSEFDDGDLYGIVDTHSHILSNFGFGGGNIFHGSPFHRLGVEHALPDCEPFHGPMGRKDFFGFGYDGGGLGVDTLLPLLLNGELGEDNHFTAGYPEFTEWPSAPYSSTHQTQYYLWLERAYLAGLRLVIQHATTNSVICDFMVGQDYQRARYSCNDMVAVDRIIEETYNMERYIDAQAGGPGKGFFRVVDTPAKAREVIAGGKMAVVLGIETSNLFDCFSVEKEGAPNCDADYVRSQLDDYYERGVRVMFPVHKYDNAFTAGDGHRDFIELGNYINSGHYSDYVLECPTEHAPGFDKGNIAFGGIHEPRDEYLADPPVNMDGFADAPVQTLTLNGSVLRLVGGGKEGDYCQKHGMTPLGETLLKEMMLRGIVIEIDHFPRHSYGRAVELLEEFDYPAAGTHGRNIDGRIYALGGVSKTGLGRCRADDRQGAMLDSLKARVELITENGGYPAEGFGFDLNGFAGGPRPRFGDRASCDSEQTEPVTYPFVSHAGDVTFSEPSIGNRTLDFNTEGMAHIGLLPELIDDARRDAADPAELDPLFRSAEGYIRMWEHAERRGEALRASQ